MSVGYGYSFIFAPEQLSIFMIFFLFVDFFVFNLQFHDNFHVRNSDSTGRSFPSALAYALENREGTAEEVVPDPFSYNLPEDIDFVLLALDLILPMVNK